MRPGDALQLPFIIGHRGIPSLAYENSKRSFELAKEHGCELVELDVKLSKDKKLVVFHDDDLQRLTGLSDLVKEKPLSELLKTPLILKEKEYEPQTILSFDDFLILLKEAKLHVNIEIKPNDGEDKETAEAVLEALNKHKLSVDSPNHILISSFSHISLSCFRKLNTTFPVGLLYEELPKEWCMHAQELNGFAIVLDKDKASLETIKEIKSKGYKVLLYTVNDEKEASFFKTAGVDAIFSDVFPKLKILL
jgi:glycerophosphoryl diester phosphodiesterase